MALERAAGTIQGVLDEYRRDHRARPDVITDVESELADYRALLAAVRREPK